MPRAWAWKVGRIIQQNGFAPGVVIHLQDIEVGHKFLLTDAKNQPVKATLHSPPVIDPAGAPPALLCIWCDPGCRQRRAADCFSRSAWKWLLASQGETVNNEVVGSGDASHKFQSFPLQETAVDLRSGIRARRGDQQLECARKWVALAGGAGSLRAAGQRAGLFYLHGEDGRRLVHSATLRSAERCCPPARPNVTATYRVGAGLAGRVGAHALTTLLDRLQGLTSVNQPLERRGRS